MLLFTTLCWSINRDSLVAQTVKNLSAVQKTWVQSLGEENPLEKGIATHSNILAWRILWREEPSRLQSMGSQRESDMTEQLTLPTDLSIALFTPGLTF